MATARLLSRPVVRVRAQARARARAPSCFGAHYDHQSSSWMKDTSNDELIEKSGNKWPPPMSLVAEKSGKISVKVAAQTVPQFISFTSGHVVDVLPLLWANIVGAVAAVERVAQSKKLAKAQIQMLFERGLLDCRFFTLLAVAGSPLGSILCFVEGSIMIFKSYGKYFHALSQRSHMGCVALLLIEAIDMFIIGTAMLIFGMGLYTMFVGSESTERSLQQVPQSNFFGLFSLKTMPQWVELQSLSQAKSRIGHAVMMILQVGILEKFKDIPLATSLDLACLAGAVVVSSACIFVLAKLAASRLN